MRKMPYAILFIVILAILVFAGCKAFSHNSGDDTEPATGTSDVTGENADTLPPELENITDENGETVYSPEELSSMYDEISSFLADPDNFTLTSEESGTSGGEEGATGTGETATGKSGEATTAKNGAQTTQKPETTTQGTPATQKPETTTSKTPETTTKPAAPTGKTEYDILRSGRFYMEGSLVENGQKTPLVLAVGSDIAYMNGTMDGVSMGFLIINKKTYLINATQKTYCEFGALAASILQISEEEIMEGIDNMGFTSMQPLSEAASVSSGVIGSTVCEVYTFDKSDGMKSRIYMNGTRLVAIENVKADGQTDSITYVDRITDQIPQLPPADYKKQGIAAFVLALKDVLGE